MSTTGQDYSPTAVPLAAQPRVLTEEEWRASLPSLRAPSNTDAGRPAAATIPRAVTTSPSGWAAWPTQSNTRAVWWFVVTPLITSILTAAAFFGLFIVPHNGPMTMEHLATLLLSIFAISGLAVVLQTAALIALAYRDRRQLHALHHRSAASPWWNLLSPLLYLIIRTVHVHKGIGKGGAPLVVYLLLYFVPSIVIAVLGSLYGDAVA